MSNPTCYFDINIDGAPAGRIQFLLYADTTPKVNFMLFLTTYDSFFLQSLDPYILNFLLVVAISTLYLDM